MAVRRELTDSFLVGFEGRLIECFSLEDAIAVKSAQRALLEDTECDAKPGQLERWAKVMERYDALEAAGQLLQLSQKLRATQFLIASAGYERPPRRRER
jgi:hypothetical protein